MKADPLWSIHDLADYLGVPIKTIRSWRLRGTGPVGIRVGKHIRYRRADIEAWLAERADLSPHEREEEQLLGAQTTDGL